MYFLNKRDDIIIFTDLMDEREERFWLDIIFVVFAGGIMFGMLERSKMIENTVGSIIKNMGLERKYLIVVVMTFVFGALGVFVGYENNIALVPIAAVLSLALGGDLPYSKIEFSA